MSQRIALAASVITILLMLGVIGYMLTRPAPAPAPITTPSETPVATSAETPAPPQLIRIATSALGTAGYRIAAFLSDIWNREVGLRTFVYPFVGSEAAVKALVLGEVELAYGSDIDFMDLYTWGGEFGGFAGLEREAKKLPVQTLWLYTVETFLLVKAEDADKYKCWRDLEGKSVFLAPKGFGVHRNMLRALKAVGVNVNHVEMTLSGGIVAEALEKGTIAAAVSWTIGTEILPPYGAELDLKMKLAPVNPCPDEIEKLEATGLILKRIDSTVAFKANKDMGTIIGVAFIYGWHTAVDVPEDVVYNMLVALEKVAKDYVKVTREFKQIADDFVGFQLEATKSMIAYGVPVHPGLAKFLKEKGAWNPEWDKYIARELIPKLVKPGS